MSNIKSVKLKVNYPNANTIYDITNKVVLESVRIQSRDDLSFGRGGFKFLDSVLTKNIPPYSICEITTIGADNIDVINHYVVSSTATYFMTQNCWVHDCSLMSLDSILETFILGAKTCSIAEGSGNTDWSWFNRILMLINAKYGISITQTGNTLKDYENDYTYPIGTTLFDVVKQIISKNNLKYSVSFNGLNADGHINSGYTSITNLFISFNSASRAQIIIPNTCIEYEEYNQNTDNYCKYIETQASDVIDRFTPMRVKGLTPRSTNGVLVSVDEAKLVLPLNVESIEKLEIVSTSSARASIDTNIVNNNMDGWAIQGTFTGTTTQSMGFNVYDGTLKQFIDADFRAKNTNLSVTTIGTINIFQKIWTDFFNLYQITNGSGTVLTTTDILVHTMIGSYQGVQTFILTFKSSDDSGLYKDNGVVDYTDRVLEESVWNGINVKDQPKYLVYKSGSNIIYNMNGSYRDDFWGHITGMAQGNFLTEAAILDDLNLYSNTVGLEIEFTGDTSTNPLDYQYNIECYPFTNPYLIDEKNTYPNNETSYKPLARTYSIGDNNGFATDFGLLVNDIDKQNEILGKTEHIVEVNTTNFNLVTISDNLVMPKAGDRVRFGANGETWYVSSLEHRYTKTHQTTQLNLAKNATKIADAIGVDYQYNPTRLPLENIIDRALYFEIESTNLYNALYDIAYYDSNDVFVGINFHDVLENSINFPMVKRPSIQLTNDYAILYVEAIDNVVFDYAVGAKDSFYDTYPLLPCKYVNDIGECINIDVNIYCTNQQISLNASKILPDSIALTGAIDETYSVASNVDIFKDQRERLTFTIKINKGGDL